jgi:flagellin-like protein
MKGVSPLVASVLLLAIVVSISVIIGGWTSTLTKDTTSTVSNRTSEAVQCSAADITIESVYITNGTSGTARAQVRNQGFLNITLTSAQLINRTGHNASTTTTLGTLAKGEIMQISFSGVGVPSCPSDFSKLIVTSTCGGVSHVFTGSPSCV